MDNKEIKLTKEQLVAKEKMLSKLKSEIERLKYELEHPKLTNFKRATIRGSKMSLQIAKMLAPYILTAGITFGIFSALDLTPFVIDDSKKYLRTKKELDNQGNIHIEEQYENFDEMKNMITYASAWKKDNDDFYSRTVETYVINENYIINGTSEEVIAKLLTKSNSASLTDIFGAPISQKNEKRNDLTIDELTNKEYIQATIYSKSDDDVIVIKETINDNLGWTLAWFLATYVVELVPHYFINRFTSPYNLGDYYERIYDEYPNVYVDGLRKRLVIKQSNYDRLTRE